MKSPVDHLWQISLVRKSSLSALALALDGLCHCNHLRRIKRVALIQVQGRRFGPNHHPGKPRARPGEICCEASILVHLLSQGSVTVKSSPFLGPISRSCWRGLCLFPVGYVQFLEFRLGFKVKLLSFRLVAFPASTFLAQVAKRISKKHQKGLPANRRP